MKLFGIRTKFEIPSEDNTWDEHTQGFEAGVNIGEKPEYEQ